jgi:hypothetical protein
LGTMHGGLWNFTNDSHIGPFIYFDNSLTARPRTTMRYHLP